MNPKPESNPEKDFSPPPPGQISGQSNPVQSTSSGNQKKTRILLISFVLLVILLIGAGYCLGNKNALFPFNKKEKLPLLELTEVPVTSVPISKTPLFSGQLKRIDRNLKIFKSTEDDQLNGINNDFSYYEAGKFIEGELKDYFRIIVARPSTGPGRPLVFVLATKDFQSYILDDPDNKTINYREDEWQNPYYVLDKSKISSTKTFSTEQPKEIVLNSSYSLYLEEYLVESVGTNQKDKYGNSISQAVLLTDFSSHQKLASPYDNLSFYFDSYHPDNSDLDQLDQNEKEKRLILHQYFLGYTEVIVVDSTGLPALYSMTTPGNVKKYYNNLISYDLSLKEYKNQLEKYESKQISQYPKYPDFVYLPNLGFSSLAISSEKSYKFYFKYETAVPGGCSSSMNSRVFNLNDDEVEKIGSALNLPLYRLKNTNHPLYSLAYKNKIDYYERDPNSWDVVNKGIKKPTLKEYVESNPLLFIKDYWQRWVALGEYDILLPGGCGKPVIYLYPEYPTEVSVQFLAPVQLTIDIPKYADFWKIIAYPNGLLSNLKPEFTNCQEINYKKRGSEYAEGACKDNIYPYLYWEGNAGYKNYPQINEGWIVKKNSLKDFLNDKLTQAGLNEKERNDFINYWLYEMLAKNTPYYRISFLQTDALNSLFPMAVFPQPDTILRIFLDYTPLSEEPSVLPKPQVLNRLTRNGFTLVEWGGLKQ